MTLPETMRAVLLTGHGGPERLEFRTDVPVPRPAAGEVLIRVGASAVNNTDINTRIGWYAKSVRGQTRDGGDRAAPEAGGWAGALAFPRIQGIDCCGRIVATGAGVDPARIGTRVLVRPMYHPQGAPAGDALETLGSERDGAFADYMTVEAKQAFAVDSDLGDVELATFPCAFSTAEALIQRADLGAERVLVTGASGGVGAAAVQLAARRGAEVTVVTQAAKAAALRTLGARTVLERDADLPGEAFDVVIDLVGGARWPALLDALAVGGRYVTSGAIAGPIVELDLRTLYLKDLSLLGSTRQPPSVFSDLVGYIEDGSVRPVLAATFPLEQLRVAQEVFLTKHHVGKIGISLAP